MTLSQEIKAQVAEVRKALREVLIEVDSPNGKLSTCRDAAERAQMAAFDLKILISNIGEEKSA